MVSFEQKQLIGAIKTAMTKAKLPRQEVARVAAVNQSAPVVETASEVGGAEIQALNQKIAKMQSEIDGLKKQLSQIVMFINQKLK